MMFSDARKPDFTNSFLDTFVNCNIWDWDKCLKNKVSLCVRSALCCTTLNDNDKIESSSQRKICFWWSHLSKSSTITDTLQLDSRSVPWDYHKSVSQSLNYDKIWKWKKLFRIFFFYHLWKTVPKWTIKRLQRITESVN